MVSTRSAEESLIHHTLSGRPSAFGDLVQPYLTQLVRFARRRTGDASAAEDVIQSAVLHAFGNLHQFRHEASFKTWLSAIAWNEATQWRRALALVQKQRLSDLRAAAVPDPGDGPHMQCQRKQETERLRQAIAGLPEKYRKMIQLRDLRELTVAETARSLALTPAAVKTRHHRARNLLRRTMVEGSGGFRPRKPEFIRERVV